MTINDSDISNNQAGFDNGDGAGDGGGIANDGIMFIANSVINNNKAVDDSGANGGGIFNQGEMTIDGSTIDGNTVTTLDGEARGGGIANDFSGTGLTVTNSTISNNTVTATNGTASGGGIRSEIDLTIINSTISNNSVTSTDDANGGGLLVENDQTTTILLTNVTMSDNSATSTVNGDGLGGAVFRGDPDLTITINNSILANATSDGAPGGDCVLRGDPVFNSNFSLYENTGDGACGLAAANPDGDGNIVGQDPNLGALGNNGGPTETHLPLAGSLAINNGSNPLAVDENAAPLTADQRGFTPRINDGTVEMGSVEVGAAGPPSDNACPVDPEFGTVGAELTTLLGTGMGSPTRSRMVAKITIPNAGDVTELYGQMAGKEYNGVKYVRFIFGDKSYQQVPTNGGTFDLGDTGAISWWGDDLTTQFQSQARPFVKGRWFLQKGMKKMRIPRAIVMYPTHDTGGDEYANAWSTFGYPDNFVAGTSGFDQTNTNVLPIPETQATTDIVVQVAVTDVNRDPRTVDVIVPAGGVGEITTLTGPTKKKSELLNIFEVTLEGVPAGMDEVEIELVSVLDEGDSAALLGAAASYVCEVAAP